jgi:flagellar hook-associated protein 2
MEPIATFSGLSSGVQWRDLIDEIMQVERRPARLIEQQITQIQTRSAAWLTFQNKLSTFQDAIGGLADGSTFDSFSTAVSGSGFTASASSDAGPGSYSVEVLELAAAEKLGGDAVASDSDALGQTGEFWLNGRRIEVATADTLQDVAYAINGANTGADATGVTASVVTAGDGYQLVLTSQATGADGIDLAGGDGLLQALGFTDGTTAIKHGTSDGARSDGFDSSTTAVSTLRGLTGTTTGQVTLGTGAGAFQVDIDLTKDLDAIAADINTAATTAGTGVTAAVITESVDGETVHRLDISGTTSFTDANGVLEKLGILEGGRSAVAQVITSGTALQSGGAAATSTTDLTTLEIDGTSTNTQVGDTFTVSGTRGDGTTFSMTLEVAASADLANGKVATLGDVVDALNGADGYNGTATAAVAADGSIAVTDGSGGASQLGLSIVANNQGGGSLDFAGFDVTTLGRSREIVDGTDAAFRVDGVYSTHDTNSVSDVIQGVSLTLTAVNEGSPGTVTVSRDIDAVVSGVQALVSGYNGVASFVTDQFTGGEGSAKPLAGDSTLRGMRNRIRSALQTVLTTGVGGEWSRLGDLGIEIQRDGTFEVDETTLRDALASDPLAVERLFGIHGSASGSGLRYVGSGDDTVSGDYTVDVTAAATTASVVGAGSLADGTYDGPTETLTLTDLGTGKSYAVAMTNGQTASSLVDEINAVLDTATSHTITSAAMDSDTGGTAVTESTTWDQVHQGGALAGVADGDTLTLSGRRADGTSFYETLAIDDVATQTVGELRDRIQNAVGSDATVELVDGAFEVTAGESGSSLLELTLSSDNAGGGTLDLSTTVQTEGRPQAGITASLDAGTGELKLVHDDYGSTPGFRVEYSVDAATELGLGASGTEYTGTDIQGTIGGMAATGSGQLLTGADGTDVDGLMVRADATFSSGSILFSRGVGSLLEQAVDPMLDSTDDGSIQSLVDGLGERVTDMTDRVADIDARLERRRDELIRRFTAMEQAMAVAQNQSSWLTSQIATLPSYSSNAE